MLDRLKSLFEKSASSDEHSDVDPLPLSLAALMIEAAKADQVQTQQETALIKKYLLDGLGLEETAADPLLIAAAKAQEDAVDLHQFTKHVKTLSAGEKGEFIEMLWKVVLSDDDRDPYEDAVIRRIASLIYVSDLDSGAARQRAEAALKS
ncbi:MAG: TerB family tellurite resistance protein [Pseudomonadota bacterium]